VPPIVTKVDKEDGLEGHDHGEQAERVVLDAEDDPETDQSQWM
jgi:hypothetical protein